MNGKYHPIRVVCPAATVFACVALTLTSVGHGGPFIELEVPLHEGRCYEPAELARQASAKLGGRYYDAHLF